MDTTGATHLRLPWPPSVNTYWRRMVVGGRSVVSISKQGRAYRKAVVGTVLQRLTTKPDPLTGRIGVRLDLWAPDRRKRDVDNHLKALLDALTHAGIWQDDSQVDELHVYRQDVRAPGAAVVEIWEREA